MRPWTGGQYGNSDPAAERPDETQDDAGDPAIERPDEMQASPNQVEGDLGDEDLPAPEAGSDGGS